MVSVEVHQHLRESGLISAKQVEQHRFLTFGSNKVCLSVKLPLQTPHRQSRLFCRYYDNDGHPKYVIGPVKQEDEWDRPHIVRYHDVLSNRDVEKVKELATPRVRGNIRNICLSLASLASAVKL